MNMLFFSFLLTAPAVSGDSLCPSPRPITVSKRIPVENDINWFLRSSPGTGQVTFATAQGNSKILKIDTSESMDLPGNTDPVLTPDGKILAMPKTYTFDPKSKTFLDEIQTAKLGENSPLPRYKIVGANVYEYKYPDLVLSKLTAKEVQNSGESYLIKSMTFFSKPSPDQDWTTQLQDTSVPFIYQTLGTVDKGATGTTYRLLYEGDNSLFIRDYQLSPSNQLRVKTAPSPVCKTSGAPSLALPVLNKSGSDLTVYDTLSGMTKVYSIGASGRECNLIDTIPALVGKADFSPNNKLLAFHIDSTSDLPSIFDAPDASDHMGVFVYDRTTKALVPVQGQPGENSYYPVFLDNNHIAFVSSTIPATGEKQKFFINVAAIQNMQETKCSGCYDASQKNGQLAALVGAIAQKSCYPATPLRYRNALAVFSFLDPSKCLKLTTACDASCLKGIKDNIRKQVQQQIKQLSGCAAVGNCYSFPPVDSWNLDILDKLESGDSDFAWFCRQITQSQVISTNDNALPVSSTPAR